MRFSLQIVLLGLVLAGCVGQPQHVHIDPPPQGDGLRWLVRPSPHGILFYLDGEFIGEHHFHRGNEEFVAEMNDQSSWLVIQEGLPGDSYPTVFAYQIIDRQIVKSQQMESIKARHYRSDQAGPVEPVFLGFEPDGKPKVHSVTCTTWLRH